MNVFELSASLSLDKRQYEQGLKDAGNQAQNFGEKSSGGFQQSATGFAIMNNLINRGMNSISSSMSGAISRVDTLGNYSKTMVNLGYTTEQADKAQKKLVDSIGKLPSSLDQMVSSQQQYVTLLGDMDKATDLTIALNDATLAGGQGQMMANSAMNQWYQIIANGKPDLQSWRIINGAMPAQLDQIAKSLLGTSANAETLRTAWMDGKVSTEDVTKALVNLDKNGGKGIKKFSEQAETATGGINTSMTNMKIAITKSIASAIQAFGSENISSAFNSISDKIYAIGDVVAKVFGFMGKHTKAIGVAFTAVAVILTPLLANAIKIKAIATAIKLWEIATESLTIAQEALKVVMSTNPIGLVIIAITALVTAFVIAYKKSETFRNIVNKAFNAVKKTVVGFATAIKNFFTKTIPNSINSLKNKFVTFKNVVIATVKAIPKGILGVGENIVSGLWNGIVNKTSWLINMIKSFANNIKEKLKSFFGIHSPSRWASDVLGKNIVLGFADGITSNVDYLTDANSSMMDAFNSGNASRFKENVTLFNSNNGKSAGSNNVYSFEISIPLDGKELVKRTINFTEEELNKRKIRSNRLYGVTT